LPLTPDTLKGAVGAVLGVIDAEGVEYDPVPAAFIAATLNTYAVPFASPVTVALIALDVPSAKVVQVVPPLDEY
jgi:hypothetical protein